MVLSSITTHGIRGKGISHIVEGDGDLFNHTLKSEGKFSNYYVISRINYYLKAIVVFLLFIFYVKMDIFLKIPLAHVKYDRGNTKITMNIFYVCRVKNFHEAFPLYANMGAWDCFQIF